MMLHFIHAGEPSTSRGKLKQRRMAKKLARTDLTMPSEEDCHRDQNLNSADEHRA